MTINQYGLGKAIYIGTQSHSHFYGDLITWLRQLCSLHPLLKVPDNVEVSMREREDSQVFFLLNHQHSPLRITFYKPMHDYLTGNNISGNFELNPHGVLILDEHTAMTSGTTPPPSSQQAEVPNEPSEPVTA
jgi:beta-galactosidase